MSKEIYPYAWYYHSYDAADSFVPGEPIKWWFPKDKDLGSLEHELSTDYENLIKNKVLPYLSRIFARINGVRLD